MASAKRTYTPAEISRMSDKEVRKAYSELRSIARKRADRLEAAGFSAARFPSLRTMQLDNDEVRLQLQQVSYYVKSSSTTLSKVKQISSTLREHGYTIQDQAQFGQFMEYFRAKYKGRVIPPSDVAATLYDDAERKGITAKTLMREYGKYIADYDAMESLKMIINIIKENPKYQRLTIRQVTNIMERWETKTKEGREFVKARKEKKKGK